MTEQEKSDLLIQVTA